MKTFISPLLIAAVVLTAIGIMTGQPIFVWQAFTLAVVEVSMSFDNAIVNADKLLTMSHFWRRAFFWVGLPVAVVGMRFYMPLEIVSTIEGTSLHDAYQMAVNDPGRFTKALSESHLAIAGFGGAFLMLTALEFFLDEENATWIPFESIFKKIAVVKGLDIAAVLAASLLAYTHTHSIGLLLAAMAGMLTFMFMGAIKHGMEQLDEKLNTSTSKFVRVLSGGLGGFIFLEVLDASFSLDGVVAAFAISKNIWVVAGGLGIGAAFVRAMTVKLVESGHIAEYAYLPNGAFWSILALSVYMFISTVVHLPDWIVALVSVGFIVSSILSSVIEKRKHPQITEAVAA